MSTPKQALSDLEKGKTWPVYYLYGEEPFKIQEFVEKIVQNLFGNEDTSFCIDRMDGTSNTGNDVLEAIQSMGLFGSGKGKSNTRLVLVRSAHQLKEMDVLTEVLMDAKGSSPWGENVLVLVAETLDGRRKFPQWLKKQGYALEFKPARDAELAQWVGYLAKKRGALPDAEASRMLAVLSDGSLYRLAQEIEKAWLYAGAKPDTAITAQDVTATTSGQISHEMIELVRAVLEAKRTRALLLTEKLIRNSEDALGLVGFLTWAIKNPGRGFQGPIVGGRERIRRLIEALLELDSRLKGSGLDVQAAVEQFVIEQTERTNP